MSNRGSAFILLLLGIIVMAGLYLSYGKALNLARDPRSNAVNPIDKTREAVCQTNISLIQQALQMYNLEHEPMKVLDLQKLRGIVDIKAGTGNEPCRYQFDGQGRVICTTHRK